MERRTLLWDTHPRHPGTALGRCRSGPPRPGPAGSSAVRWRRPVLAALGGQGGPAEVAAVPASPAGCSVKAWPGGAAHRRRGPPEP